MIGGCGRYLTVEDLQVEGDNRFVLVAVEDLGRKQYSVLDLSPAVLNLGTNAGWRICCVGLPLLRYAPEVVSSSFREGLCVALRWDSDTCLDSKDPSALQTMSDPSL